AGVANGNRSQAGGVGRGTHGHARAAAHGGQAAHHDAVDRSQRADSLPSRSRSPVMGRLPSRGKKPSPEGAGVPLMLTASMFLNLLAEVPMSTSLSQAGEMRLT